MNYMKFSSYLVKFKLIMNKFILKKKFLKSWLFLCTDLDEASAWWAAIVSVAVYWLIGDDENAERSYLMAESFPKKLHLSEYVFLLHNLFWVY